MNNRKHIDSSSDKQFLVVIAVMIYLIHYNVNVAVKTFWSMSMHNVCMCHGRDMQGHRVHSDPRYTRAPGPDRGLARCDTYAY